MKGGSGNFGIVTAFTVKTHTQDPEVPNPPNPNLYQIF